MRGSEVQGSFYPAHYLAQGSSGYSSHHRGCYPLWDRLACPCNPADHADCVVEFLLWFGCIFVYINATAPTTQTLGAMHGLAQTLVAVTRAIGPASSHPYMRVVSRTLYWE
ncbi:hypothetical protein BD410DRAFT_783992 [Rickenella mellea]|uniref:Uncharacterized protein n=1 Tax=Rickenella mellea TaxID=50990 RepID=A0A4Y7QF49_9AGAM|nr:hypothetical protein BD410DRAFT_783992 [Rickenella mellea]